MNYTPKPYRRPAKPAPAIHHRRSALFASDRLVVGDPASAAAAQKNRGGPPENKNLGGPPENKLQPLLERDLLDAVQRREEAELDKALRPVRDGGTVLASRHAVKLAKSLHVPISTLTGTGPGGLITTADVRHAAGLED